MTRTRPCERASFEPSFAFALKWRSARSRDSRGTKYRHSDSIDAFLTLRGDDDEQRDVYAENGRLLYAENTKIADRARPSLADARRRWLALSGCRDDEHAHCESYDITARTTPAGQQRTRDTISLLLSLFPSLSRPPARARARARLYR